MIFCENVLRHCRPKWDSKDNDNLFLTKHTHLKLFFETFNFFFFFFFFFLFKKKSYGLNQMCGQKLHRLFVFFSKFLMTGVIENKRVR